MNNPEDPTLNISLTVTAVNTILAGLQELPFKVADPIMKDVIQQAQSQLAQQQEATSTEEE